VEEDRKEKGINRGGVRGLSLGRKEVWVDRQIGARWGTGMRPLKQRVSSKQGKGGEGRGRCVVLGGGPTRRWYVLQRTCTGREGVKKITKREMKGDG